MTATVQSSLLLQLRDEDHVAIATSDLSAGSEVTGPHGPLPLRVDVPRGHKVAVRDVAAGDQVLKYGQSIGRATAAITAGDHVHSHNLGMDATERSHEFGTARVSPTVPEDLPRTFQ